MHLPGVRGLLDPLLGQKANALFKVVLCASELY